MDPETTSAQPAAGQEAAATAAPAVRAQADDDAALKAKLQSLAFTDPSARKRTMQMLLRHATTQRTS